MADSFILTDGVKSFQLVYNSSTQVNYKLLYGGNLGISPPSMVNHAPDDNAPVPVRGFNDNRQMFFTLDIVGTNWDNVLNKIAELKRLVDGINSQAVRYWLNNRTERRVALNVLLDGATNTTKIPVLYGLVDDSESIYKAEAMLNKRARGVVIALTVLPYSEGTAIELTNALVNPGVSVSSGGLASGWADVSGTGTPSMNTTNYLTGPQSQKYVETVSGTGLASSTIVSSGTSMAGYAWVYVESGTVTIRLQNTTAATTVDTANLTATDSNSVSDRSITDDAGATWWRVPLSGTVTTAENHRIEFVTSAAATFNVDNLYLRTGTQTVPSAWVSHTALDNRNDQSNTNPTFINWFDTWGIPGDLPAILKVTSSFGAWQLYMSQARDNKTKAGAREYWIEGEGFQETEGANWSNEVDAARANGNYKRFNGTTGSITTGSITYAFATAVTAAELASCDWRVFAIAKSDDADSTLQMSLTINTTQEYQLSEAVTFTNASAWELLDLGFISARNIYASEISNVNILLKITVTTPTAGDLVDIDAIVMMPVDDQFLLANFGTLSVSLYTNGDERYIAQGEGDGRKEINLLGELWTVAAGDTATRTFMLATNDADNAHVLTTTNAVTVTVIPRARHLLGTQ